MSKKSNRFSPEVRERAVRMVQEHRGAYPSLWAAIESIAPKIGCRYVYVEVARAISGNSDLRVKR
jgi:transposase-like protein